MTLSERARQMILDHVASCPPLSDEVIEELRRLVPRAKPPYIEAPPEVGEQ